MFPYKKILIAVDLHPACDEQTVIKAISLAKQNQAELFVVHAIEFYSYGVVQAYPIALDLEEDIVKKAKNDLESMLKKIDASSIPYSVELGPPKSVILNKADEIKADLIIVGSHGRHGISLLLGSTANAVLHHAKCDVLAMRIQD